MTYQFYAMKPAFAAIFEAHPNAFLSIINNSDEKQRSLILKNFDEEAIKEGSISLLEDDSIDLHNHEFTIYKKVNDAFCWMKVYDDYIEMNDYEHNPFYHYLMRIHPTYIILDEEHKISMQENG